MSDDISLERIDVGEVTLNVATAGPADGKPILFLHGFPEFWYTWRHQLRYFAEQGWRAIAPDMRGYNLSDKPEAVEDYRVRHLIADIDGLASHYGTDRFALCAHDWGGACAWAYAMARPERLERLIIINAPHPATFSRELRENPDQAAASQYMRFFQTPEAETYLASDDCGKLWEFAFLGIHAKGHMDDDDRQAYLDAWRQPGAIAGGLNYYRASPLRPPAPDGSDMPAALDPENFRVRVPTLVIWGERDPALLTDNLNGLETLVDDLRILRLPKSTHWVTHEASDVINPRILRFLETGD
ncbi:alpha/beta fold hydrolase [Oceanibacterium hippocampi]|uniref:Soluble epoxide hydrolase n=1 Tax=Oceanibacterium hippocampi TaxID=745714 RepID=A0A1Y5T6F7_9PROT|nr:alpha/beta hydrolase [Oceanibacterium hippocampi]SLN56428.1 Soluble epoxide hydrolase [Oceanibacterium hippocampi]